ncbi:MAG: Gfo/Idh/MocA family oxidoreductase, partial [Planctomycetaceae bacterium]|nr:Gfo/Idh/MocA family oxidoreductase [Planctomycetaceae bacterium]
MSDSSRRDFLKTSSAVAAFGTGLFTSVSARAFASGDDAVRVALVGCGGRGTGAAAQALSTKGKVKLVAMADAFRDQLDSSLNNIEKAVKSKEDSEVAVEEDKKFVGFDAYKKVMESDDVDLVILATPPGFRPIHFEYAVSQGKNVFMEKPVATDAEGVRKVIEAAKVAKEKDLKVGVGLQRRHQECYLDYIKKIHDGAVGDVRALRVYWNGGGVWEPRAGRADVKSEMEYQMRNWYYYNWLCGDHICEQHIHNLDVGNWIMSGIIPEDPENIWAQLPVKANGMGGREVRKDPRYGEIFDHHAVEYTFADGTVMMSQCRHIRNCWNSVTEHAHCNNGIVHLDNNPRNVSIERFDGSKERFKGENANPYQVEHDDLFAA